MSISKVKNKIIISILCSGLMACVATESNVAVNSNNAVLSAPKIIVGEKNLQHSASSATDMITLEKIMSDPDWLGRQPSDAYWADDSQSVFYTRKREGSVVSDVWNKPIRTESNGSAITHEDLYQHAYDKGVLSTDNTRLAWLVDGNIFSKELASGKITQHTKDAFKRKALQFLLDGRLAFRLGNAFYAIEPASGLVEQLVSWEFAEQPSAFKPSPDYIAEQQVDLIEYISKKRKDQLTRFDHQQLIQASDPSRVAQPYYLPKDHELVAVSLSPAGDRVIIASMQEGAADNDNDIMPNYINDDGRIKAEKVRKRVADAKPQNHQLWLLDLQRKSQHNLSYQTLPGYNEDVLAKVKAENAKAKGETYQTNRLPRDIVLLEDWYWSQSAFQWHTNGKQLAVMLEAWDNKDRWIATLDFNDLRLVSQHRLHDDAWINYKMNGFGWLKSTETLYYLSEESGYSHLYSKALNGKPKALTSGTYEVDGVVLSQSEEYFYFKGNKKHPGIYEVYRVGVENGVLEAVTDLNGMTDFVLSPDESKLLLTHSKLTMPPELYVQDNEAGAVAKRITHTVSEAFLAMPFNAPDIVPVRSSHTDQPIFSRVYFPKKNENGEKHRAVIFNHGAGYLQNSHLGWSGYFREFMFHNMLAQQGYVVMDMDYRASAGYGRDWRTAIYRQMGTPEIEDLQDGVKWLVRNANVDRERIGTYGGSYGGFMTFMALFNAPDLFKAGAALRPVSDWAHYNHGYTSNILNTPDVDPIAYERSSPIYFAEGLEASLLINAPMVDNNVFFVDVVRLVQRLIELEKEDFETAIYPVEPHGFVQPSSWLDEYRRIYKLFEREL